MFLSAIIEGRKDYARSAMSLARKEPDHLSELYAVLGGRVNVTIHKDEGEVIQSVELSPSLGNYVVKRKRYGLIYEECYF